MKPALRRRGVAVNSGLALLGDAAAKGSGLVVVLLAARMLEPSELARLGVALAGAGILTTLLDAGTSTLLVRDGARGPEHRGGIVREAALGRVPLAVAVAVVALGMGVLLGQPVLAAATLVLALTSATALSVLAVFRSAQNLAPEAAVKTTVALTGVAAVAITAAASPHATSIIWALAAVATVGPVALARRARAAAPRPEGPLHPRATLLAALPFAAMAVATVAYYRSGTLVLGALSTAEETAAYTVASSLAFGLLLVPNAVATSLLPRLSAGTSTADVVRTARRALATTLVLCVATAVLASAAAVLLLPRAFGPAYEAAVAPLVLLASCTVVIGVNALLGATLISVRRTRAVAVQVGVSLAVNIGLAVVLGQRYGAGGAAAATAATELVALVLLAVSARRALPGLLVPPHRTAPLKPADAREVAA
jgi:O-antigen/teichoic acid export membrane protein